MRERRMEGNERKKREGKGEKKLGKHICRPSLTQSGCFCLSDKLSPHYVGRCEASLARHGPCSATINSPGLHRIHHIDFSLMICTRK